MGNIIDEAGVFEERLVPGPLDLEKASRSTVLRTLGRNKGSMKQYGVSCENPPYAAWLEKGLKLVRRLDGTEGVPDHLRDNR